MSDTNAVLSAGAIAPLSTSAGKKSAGEANSTAHDTLLARAFAHPALGDRVVVRLSEATLSGSLEVEMGVLGFSPSTDGTPVGLAKRRALGFPAWALVKHPDEARFALEVTREMRAAFVKLKKKPGHAKEALVSLAKRMERSIPAFLPSYWEEAARAFVAAENPTLAGQCFEKARAAERVYELAVDEDERAQAYLELTLAGAVPAKSLSGYADELVAAYGAVDGERRYRELNVQRVRGGLAPFTGLGKTLRKLAKAAKRNEQEADDDFLVAVLDAPAFAKSPSDFWSLYLPALRRLAEQQPKARKRLAWLFPTPKSGANGARPHVLSWLAFLEETHLAEDVLGQADGADAARWLGQLTRYVTDVDLVGYDDDDDDETKGERGIPAAYFRLMDTLAPRIRELGSPVSVEKGGSWGGAGEYDVDILEHALSLGLTLADPRSVAAVDEDDWAEDASIDLHREPEADPARVAADLRYGPLLDEAVSSALGDSTFEKWAAKKPALAGARKRALQKKIAPLAKGGLAAVMQAAEDLAADLPASLWRDFPEEATLVATTSLTRVLARALRLGLADELTWPAFEKAIDDLAPKQRRDVLVSGSARHLVVVRGRKAIVFEGAKRLKTYDLPAVVKDGLRDALYLDGDLLLRFFDDEYDEKGLWLSNPKDVWDGDFSRHRQAIDTAVAGGGVTLGAKAIRAGDVLRGTIDRPHATDGTTFWHQQTRPGQKGFQLVEMDPLTGVNGAASVPPFARGAVGATPDETPTSLDFYPVGEGAEGSPLGVKDGLHGTFQLTATSGACTVVRVDGVIRSAPFRFDALLSLPGATTPAFLRVDAPSSGDEDDELVLLDEGGAETCRFGEGGWRSEGFSRMPPLWALHYATPRDEAGSRALRALSDHVAAKLIEAAKGELDESDEEDDDDGMKLPEHKATEAALGELVPQLTSTTLRRTVANVVARAAKAEQRLSRVGEAAGDSPAAGGSGPTDEQVCQAFFLLQNDGYGDGDVVRDIAQTNAFLRGEKAAKLTSTVPWEESLERWPKLLSFLASRDTLPEPHRPVLVALLRGLLASGLLGTTLVRGRLSVEKGSALWPARGAGREPYLVADGDTRVLLREADGDDDELDDDEVEDEDDEARRTLGFLALRGESTWRVPANATLLRASEVLVADVAPFLEGFLRELEARGPAPFDPAASAFVATHSPLKLREATYLLAGLPPGKDRWANDFLGKALREKLELKVGEAKSAKEAIEALDRKLLAGLLDSAVDVAAPGAYWAAADDAAGLVGSLVRAANETLGGRRELPDELAKALSNDLSIDLAPDQIASLLLDEKSRYLQLRAGEIPLDDVSSQGDWLSEHVVDAVAKLVPYLALHRPFGDPFRAALAPLVSRVRTLLETPSLLFGLGSVYEEKAAKRAAWLEKLGGREVSIRPKRGAEKKARETELMLAVDDGEYSVDLFFRPSFAKAHAAELERFSAPKEDDKSGEEAGLAVLFLLSPAVDTLLADIAESVGAEAGYPGNPLLSAPPTVAEVAKKHGLEQDAAALYLQTLALPRPTQALVCLWNGWTTARYKKAAAALSAAKGLVVVGKRERAGREIFLPGAWEKRSENGSAEAWKLPLLGQALALREPFGTLYPRAWARVLAGDGPGFEKTPARAKATK